MSAKNIHFKNKYVWTRNTLLTHLLQQLVQLFRTTDANVRKNIRYFAV